MIPREQLARCDLQAFPRDSGMCGTYRAPIPVISFGGVLPANLPLQLTNRSENQTEQQKPEILALSYEVSKNAKDLF